MRLPAFFSALALAACVDTVPPPAVPTPAVPSSWVVRAVTIDDDLAFLRAHGPVEVLTSPGGGVVVVSARWQGRVMTSAVEAHGASLGFIHRAFLEAGKTGTAFDNYGGEDRFWLGPEGGQGQHPRTGHPAVADVAHDGHPEPGEDRHVGIGGRAAGGQRAAGGVPVSPTS